MMPVKQKKVPKAEGLSVQEKFMQTRLELQDSLIERDGEIDVVLTALICGEHPLLVGPPGTAKSMLLDSLMRWMSLSEKFEILMGKFTVPEEVFGPISMQGMKQDIYRRVTTGMLPEAYVAFLDEIFKASSAILNTTLRILNERLFCNGDGKFKKVPLQICIAASNEWPNDQEGGKELGALFDRFLFRKQVKPICTKAGRKKLLWTRNHSPKFSTSVDDMDIDVARDYSRQLQFSDSCKEAVMDLLDELAKEGIRPGDRRQYKSIAAVQAYAYLCGVGLDDEIQREHLEILAHVLWDDPTEQPEKCAKIVAKIANPASMIVNEKLSQIQDILDKNSNLTDAIEKIREIKGELENLPKTPTAEHKIEQALEFTSDTLKELMDKVIGVRKR